MKDQTRPVIRFANGFTCVSGAKLFTTEFAGQKPVRPIAAVHLVLGALFVFTFLYLLTLGRL